MKKNMAEYDNRSPRFSKIANKKQKLPFLDNSNESAANTLIPRR